MYVRRGGRIDGGVGLAMLCLRGVGVGVTGLAGLYLRGVCIGGVGL